MQLHQLFHEPHAFMLRQLEAQRYAAPFITTYRIVTVKGPAMAFFEPFEWLACQCRA